MSDASNSVYFHDHSHTQDDLRQAVLTGLSKNPKSIPPKFFYDERGSQLFDAICELPEYYPTRAEMAILQSHIQDIAQLIEPQSLLVELGSGASKKIRLLLDALKPSAYMAVDISKDFLLQTTRQLALDYPWLAVHATCADFTKPFDLTLPEHCGELKRIAFFAGSSIGNFEPQEAILLLQQIRTVIGRQGALLIGVDLQKDPRLLHAAYNDAQGITAAFNLNLLERIRTALDTDLEPRHFAHWAFYNESMGRIEMHLRSLTEQRIRIENLYFEFKRHETIHTENSYKYSIAGFQALAQRAGYQPQQVWTDTNQLFSVHFLTVAY